MGGYEDIRRAVEETGPRALELLTLLVPELESRGWSVAMTPYFLDSTEGRHIWAFRADREGFEPIDVFVELVVAADGGYSACPEDGVGFNLKVVTVGGRPVLDWEGYNYRKDLWVPAGDPGAVAARWDTFRTAVLRLDRWLPETLAFAERDPLPVEGD